uniref:AF4/FMR2 family member lilli n=1 Tax=Parastrongyloides trichosuri TaxID=131310 RepID=A0A0N4Z4D7_PARTI
MMSSKDTYYENDRSRDVTDRLREILTSDTDLLHDYVAHVYKKSESYKFIRMADDLHDVARYLNDMRLCFIALTVEAQPEFNNRGHGDDQNTNSTGTMPTQNFMSRNSRSTAPTFMRHGMSMNHSQQTTRLMTDLDGTVKHQLPKISSINETNNSTDTEHEMKNNKTSNEKRNGVMDI